MTTPAASRAYPFPRLLRIIGLTLIFGVIGYWGRAGAHTGFSQNKVPIQKVDEITGIVYTEFEDRFIPGIEVLAGGVGFGALLLIASFLFRRKS